MSYMTRSPSTSGHARDSRGRADDEVGVTQVVGSCQDERGALRLIAVRRSDRQRHDVIELADGKPAQVLHSIYGEGAAAADHAFKTAGTELARAQALAA